MLNLLDLWIVIAIFLWSILFIIKNIRKKSLLSCDNHCDKAIFTKPVLLKPWRKKS